MVIVLSVALLFSFAALFFAVNSLASLLRDQVPYVPAPEWVIQWIADNVQFPTGQKIYDLGCGDARALRKIQAVHPNIVAAGLERAWWPFLLARWRCRNTGVQIHRADFHKVNLVDANIIFCYLMNSVMGKVEKTLRPQVRSGTIIVSFAFPFPNWQPAEIITNPNNSGPGKLYVYRT